MDSGQELTGILTACPRRSLAAPIVDVAKRVQAAVALPGVSDDRRARFDVVGDEGVQRPGRCVGQGRHPAPTQPPRPADLHGDAGQDLLALGSPAPQPGSCPPMKVSSTSTVPVSCSRSGRTRTERKRCSIAQAVW